MLRLIPAALSLLLSSPSICATPAPNSSGFAASPQKGEVYGRPLAEWAGLLGGTLKWDVALQDRISAIRALGVAGAQSERHVDALIAVLGAPIEETDSGSLEYIEHALRVEVAQALVQIGTKSLPKLGRALASPEARARAGVAFAISEFQHVAAPLEQQLRAAWQSESDALVRVWLISALAGVVADPGELVDELASDFDAVYQREDADSDSTEASKARRHLELQSYLIALGRLGRVAAPVHAELEALRGKLGPLDALLRSALICVGPPDVARDAPELTQLVEVLVTEWQQMPTQHAIRLLGARAIDPIVASIGAEGMPHEQRLACAWLLFWLGTSGMPGLTSLAASDDIAVVKAALEVLQSVAGPEHARALVPALGIRHEPETRQMLGVAFGARGGAAALDALGDALEAREPLVQLNALRCLAVLVQYHPKLAGWKKLERGIAPLERSRDDQVKLEAEVTLRAVRARVE
jgi:hypothetical protein